MIRGKTEDENNFSYWENRKAALASPAYTRRDLVDRVLLMEQIVFQYDQGAEALTAAHNRSFDIYR